MRSQAERDAKTLDIMSAVFGAAVIWGLLMGLIAWIVSHGDVGVSVGPVPPVLLVIGYGATVVVLIRRRPGE